MDVKITYMKILMNSNLLRAQKLKRAVECRIGKSNLSQITQDFEFLNDETKYYSASNGKPMLQDKEMT